MKIIEASYRIETPFGALDEAMGISMLRYIERQARISHKSEEGQTEDSWRRFLRSVLVDRGDWSIAEHASVTVVFRVDRGVTHELVRHRLFSFTQESTRFVNGSKKYPDGLEFIKPTSLKPECEFAFNDALNQAEINYLDILHSGGRPQEARSVLPNALAATIAVTGNLRNWRKFLLSRVSQETHPDFRRLTVPLLADFQKYFPILFEDIVPAAKQIHNFRKAS